jgi:hypothetical protein
MAASGLLYTAKNTQVSVSNAAQNLWEFILGAASILIHSIRLEFVPTITSGVAQDVRAQINVQRITTTGSGGTGFTPNPVNPRNTVAALTTCNSLVTTPGTAGIVHSSHNPSIILPFERIYTPDQRLPVPANDRIAINLAAALGGTFLLSSEIYFEEI